MLYGGSIPKLHDFQILVDPAADLKPAFVSGIKAHAIDFVAVAVPAYKRPDILLLYARKCEGKANRIRFGQRRKAAYGDASGADFHGCSDDGPAIDIKFHLSGNRNPYIAPQFMDHQQMRGADYLQHALAVQRFIQDGVDSIACITERFLRVSCYAIDHQPPVRRRVARSSQVAVRF